MTQKKERVEYKVTLEMKPLGNSCNLACTYCYQEPMRNAGNVRASKGYDVDLMMKIGDERNKRLGIKQGYTMFGGESLLVPKKDLEKFFRASYEKYGSSSIQSNGSLIDDDHIELFKKYKVHVGISIDGPAELNGLRVSAQKNKTTEELTNATMENFRKLSANGITCGIIITIHKVNGIGENLDRVMNMILWLAELGFNSGNIHMLEVDSPEAAKYALTPEENNEAFIRLADFFEENSDKLSYSPFNELSDMMRGKNATSCIWSSCDPMNTQAVYGIEGNGQLSNCGMVNKEGIEWTKPDNPDTHDYMRDIVLYQTEPEYGGCKGCPFFVLCNGYCPGSSIDGDWRNKTTHCKSIKRIMKYYEEKVEASGEVPFSKRLDRKFIEKKYIEGLYQGVRYPLEYLIEQNKNEVKVLVK